MIHTTRERRRNAGGSLLGDKGGAIVPLVGGVAGGVATVYGAEKFGLTPLTAAGVGVAAGLGLQAATKSPLMKQALMGVAIGAGTLGGLQLIASARAQAAKPSAPPAAKRQADGDGFITRGELNDALSKLAEAQKSDMKEQQKQQTCDLLTALRDEVKRIVADTQRTSPQRPTAPPLYFVPRQADGIADGAESIERNAVVANDYMTNAYGAGVGTERNADGDVEGADVERNADGEDEAA